MTANRFGVLLSEGIHGVANRQHLAISDVEKEIAATLGYSRHAVARWRRGYLPTKPEHVAFLIRYCIRHGRVDRAWAHSLLWQAKYPHPKTLLDELLPLDASGNPQIVGDLPFTPEKEFVGRRQELTRLLDFLSPAHGAHLISITGLGGVGKTALALQAAWVSLHPEQASHLTPSSRIRVPTFDLYLFVAAQYSTSSAGPENESSSPTLHTLQQIFREIARVLGKQELIQPSTLARQKELAREILAQQRTLLIIDNLNLADNQQSLIDFLYDMPAPVKVVVTSRDQVFFSPIRLEGLPREEGIELMRRQARAIGVEEKLDEDAVDLIYRSTAGIPAAITYTVQQIATSDLLHGAHLLGTRLINRITNLPQMLVDLRLRDRVAYELLKSLALFVASASADAVGKVAGLKDDPEAVRAGLAQLVKLSLVNQFKGRYTMLPSVREYLLKELEERAALEAALRERWVAWYLNLVAQYGGSDWQDWHINYDCLEEEWVNLLGVFDWCKAQIDKGHKEKYEKLRIFWGHKGVQEFANIYGHWNDRVTWLTYISEVAERYGDTRTLVRSLSYIAWTEIMTAQFKQARQHLERAASFSSHPTVGRLERATVLCFMGILHIRERRFDEALQYLKRSEDLLKQATGTQLKDEGKEYDRAHFTIRYYQAEVNYRSTMDTSPGKLQNEYKALLKEAQRIGWQRAAIYVQNWLADIAIDNPSSGDYDKVEVRITQGMSMASQNKDKRREALFRRSLARLKYKQGQITEAHRQASEALVAFRSLGMQLEVDEMQHLVAILDSDRMAAPSQAPTSNSSGYISKGVAGLTGMAMGL